MEQNTTQRAAQHLKTAHNKLMQAQQTLDNRELNEQKLLEEALDAVNQAQQALGGTAGNTQA